MIVYKISKVICIYFCCVPSNVETETVSFGCFLLFINKNIGSKPNESKGT